MKMPIIEAYLDDLIKNSTLDVPAWNIEAARKGGKSGWNYIDGCMILAMIETWKITGEKKYLDFAEAYIDHRVQEDGTIKGYNPEDYNIDNVNAGKTLFLLYDITSKEKYRKAIDVIYGQLKGQPRTSEGNFWHKKIYRIRFGLTDFIWDSHFIWNMRHALMTRRTIQISLTSSSMS